MLRIWIAVLTVVAAVAGIAYWHANRPPAVPAGIIASNGRLEAREIDLAAKYGGRVVEVTVDEGDKVAAGQVLVRLDTAELEAELRLAQAERRNAEEGRRYAKDQVALAETEMAFAKRELDRSLGLEPQSHVSREKVDQDRTRWQKAGFSLAAARAQADQADAAVASAMARVEQLQARIAECTLAAPRDARVLYRLAHAGEVLAAGGKALTLLDMADVYMPLFLPESAAGRLAMGAEARVVLDAMPELPMPAHLSFVSPQAQFTPKQVETFQERQKLVFRAKAQVELGFLREHADWIKPGLPGMGYVRLEPAAPWPETQR